METTRFSIILVLILLVSCQSKNEPQQIDCQPPATLIAKAPCESGYPGVQLVASSYVAGSATQFIYRIFVQKDTLSSDLIKSSYANASNEQIIISDTILKDAPKFVAQVSINCGTGKDYPSKYFAFVKRPATNPGCYVWALQNL
ncbi:hypothetical protein GO730_33120 [Spirosoma sp. HMF3257]|uniref:Lipoprotein n=1 Tax=Spirosoma telluris TaxID=2183553 RepID=A0A327NR42_9BACT|nr:hypothetical protein [Spirosoma telluris]RAI77762.1 hypothetical protein HMF3257_33025 [Spirosoma telluris]